MQTVTDRADRNRFADGQKGISSMKGPTFYPFFWLNNAHKILMRKALFNYVGIKQTKFFEFGNMESPRGRHQEKLEKVYRYFRKIDR